MLTASDPKTAKNRTIYISYDGMLEPLGESQVVQYLERLSQKYLHQFCLVSFEKPNDLRKKNEIQMMRMRLEQSGIKWIPLRYHKRPSLLATAFDVVVGFLVVLLVSRKFRPHRLHARSYVPSVIALYASRWLNIPWIFDMRGFWADEKVDSKQWPPSALAFRLAKIFETKFLLSAHSLVSLTAAGKEVIESKMLATVARLPRITVIPTCTNLQVFMPKGNAAKKNFRIGHSGTVGNWYDLERTMAFMKQLVQIRPEAEIVFLNRGEHDLIRKCAQKFEILNFEIKSVQPKQVAAEIAIWDLTVFFIRPTFSKIASCPTRLGEFWGVGTPVVSGQNVGDVEAMVNATGAGLIINNECAFTDFAVFAEKAWEMALQPDIRKKARAAAENYFSLESGCMKYDRIYQEMVGTNGH